MVATVFRSLILKDSDTLWLELLDWMDGVIVFPIGPPVFCLPGMCLEQIPQVDCLIMLP